MRTRSIVLLSLVVLVALPSVGCSCTKTDCLKTFPEICKEIPQPTPGPKIIIRKSSAGNALQWYTNDGGSGGDVLQSAGGSAWDSRQIRNDFVGTKILDWSVRTTGGVVYSPANHVAFATRNGNDTYVIEMIRTAGDKVRWYITKNNNRVALTPVPPGEPNKVPVEFTYPLDPNASHPYFEEVENAELELTDYFRVEK